MKIKIAYFKNSGEAGEPISLEIDEKKAKINPVLISQALHVENNRLMTKNGLAKKKGEVSGGGRKPWKQKGTGRARAGSLRSPLFRGGGITFGPNGDHKTLYIPKKMKNQAYIGLLAAKAKEKELCVIEDIKLQERKTKAAQVVISKIAPARQFILSVDDSEMPDVLFFRNISLLEVKKPADITLSDLNTKKQILFSLKAFEQVKSKLKK